MKITVEQFREAQQKVSQLREKLQKNQDVIDQWNTCCRKHGDPAAGYEITGFIIAEDGTVDAMTRRNGNMQHQGSARKE